MHFAFQSHQLYSAATAAGMKDYAGFTDRLEFFFCVMPSISLQTEFGPRPAAGLSRSLFLSLSLSDKASAIHY